jgi:hypothetical protein
MDVMETRYVLALGDDADRLERSDKVFVVRRVRNVVLAQAEKHHATWFARTGEYVHVYRHRDDAYRALSVFDA